jgi:endonuclease YncB( thermonuclease family)
VTDFGPFDATINRIHDGDTLFVDVHLFKQVRRGSHEIDADLGFNVHMRHDGVWLVDQSIRLFGCNAAELATPEGKAALAFLETIVKPGDQVTLVSHGWDKYGGRVDGTLTLADGRDLAAVMIAANQAAPWDGQGVKPVPSEPGAAA